MITRRRAVAPLHRHWVAHTIPTPQHVMIPQGLLLTQHRLPDRHHQVNIPTLLHLPMKKALRLHPKSLAGKDPWEHNAATCKATTSCSCRSIQHLASEDLKKGSGGDSSFESMSPKNPSESHSMRSGRDSGEREEDTTRGIGGGEAEESLDSGILAKREWRRM